MPCQTAAQWPAKPRRITQAETAEARRKVQEVARRMREERIKGRPNAWTGLLKHSATGKGHDSLPG